MKEDVMTCRAIVVSNLAYDMSISVDPMLDLADPRNVGFYNQCKQWASKIFCICNGGVSLKMSTSHTVNGTPIASFWWNGKSITTIEFRYPTSSPPRFEPYWFARVDAGGNKWITVTESDIWDKLFQPLLLELIVNKERALLDEREDAIKTANWSEIKPR